MQKILKKYTIIPKHLYIERNADTQLKTIINEMERPGYVLVARQMGKTNLLFNAKRTLENDNRLFVYVDLSSVFKFEKDCYRNIIDNIIEPNEDIFEEIEKKIYEIRKEDLPPNKEYSKCLRVILKYFGGNIIIVLDEIDALASTDYSDHIFAQIRSTYFSRTNFPIYNHLTYILSGVIEPSDLIKDKNKSPFNIGEKIYLNDFTIEEHNLFIEKSQLRISKKYSDGIFSWTSGNPRLTFDICSDIESNIIDGLLIDKESINKLIREKYLVNFDIPPIDHIRELVRTNKIIRDAVLNIQKNLNNISDEMKHKLYLYGIINSCFDNKTVIKNRIISEALSLNWINSIENQNQNTLAYGVTLYETKEYKNAIEVFKSLLENSSLSLKEKEGTYYYLGHSFYFMKELDNAINYLSFDFEQKGQKRKALSILGRCYLEKKSIKDALKIFENIIENEVDDTIYYYALLNLIANLSEKHSEKIIELSIKLFSLLESSKNLDNDELNQLKTLSLYYQYKTYKDLEKYSDALQKLVEAEQYANDSDYLAFIFLEYEEIKDEDLKKKLVDNIIDNKITFNRGYQYPISFNQENLLKYMNFVFNYSDLNIFEKFLNYLEIYLLDKSENKFEIIYELSRIYEENKVDYLNYILEHDKDVNNILLLKVFRDLALSTKKNTLDFLKYFDEYLDIFKKEKPKPIDKDILLFALTISELSRRSLGAKEPHRQELFDHGLELCSLMEKRMENIEDEGLLFESLIIYYWHASIYFNINDQKKSSTNRKKILFYCDKTLKIINTSKREKTSMIDEEGLKLISKQMIDMKDSYKIRVPIVNKTKQGRNKIVKVEYIDGTIKEGKYKKFVADIIEERCKIIE